MRLLAASIALLAATFGSAQNTDEYLKVRKGLGITQAVGVEALETLVGVRVLEVQGVVKGTMSSNGTSLLLLEGTGGHPLFVSAKTVPEWLQGNEIHARLIIRATRESETFEPEATLICAAPESVVFEHEEAKRLAAARAAAAAKADASARQKTKPPVKSVRNWNLSPHEALEPYVAFIRNRNKRLTREEAVTIATGVIGFSVRYGVDARLIMAMLMVESGFNPAATSSAGAMGLGQLMPGTARGMGVGNPYDSIENLYGTVRLIRGHLDKYGKQTGSAGSYESLVLALAAYNAGGGAVARHGGVPPYRETQNYIRKVIAYYERLCGGR